ncbi:PDCD10 and GCKIII kinases-associated protein 1 isoform 2-T2 [Mantella aurantiaca]
MGCNCCRMLNSYMFKPQEPHTNGYVNEAHSYENDRSKSPTIKISELMNEGQNIIDRFTGSQDLYSVSEKIIAKNDEVDSSDAVTVSSYMVLNINFAGEIKEQDAHTSQFNDNLQTKTSTHSLEQNVDLSHNSHEKECIQYELCESDQETNSYTESATLETQRSMLTLDSINSISNSSGLNEFPESEDFAQGSYPPEKCSHDFSSPTTDIVSNIRSKEPSLISLIIERNSARASKKGSVITNGIQSEDDLDPEVAEALAALAAAIAGEEYEDI